jgi:hypothetical protein
MRCLLGGANPPTVATDNVVANSKMVAYNLILVA